MITLRQHVPAFVNDGDGGWTHQAATLKDLFAIPAVAVYAKDVEPVEWPGLVTGWVDGVEKTVKVIHPAPEEQRFFRWSLSHRNEGGARSYRNGILMVEHNHGDYFWVVGYLHADDPAELAELPEWRETDNARRRREAWNRGDIGKQKTYRCAEHGVVDAECCLPLKLQSVKKKKSRAERKHSRK